MSSPSDSALTGSCLCSDIKYKLVGAPSSRVLCHCTNCKKASGSLYAANWWFKKDQLEVTSGAANLHSYSSEDTDSGSMVTRFFCATCSSPIYIEAAQFPGVVVVQSGTLDGVFETKPQQEFYTKRRSEWMTEVDGTNQHLG